MTSDTLTRGQIYDAASTIVRPALLQIPGVGGVNVSGASLPAVRVEINPLALSKYGIGLEDVRAALAAANANSPKGAIEDGGRRYQIYNNDQTNRAADYRPLIIAYRNGQPVRLSDIGEVQDSVENIRSQGLSDGKSAVLIFLGRQSGANVIDIVDRVRALLPQLKASIPHAIDIELTMDWTTTIKTSLRHVQRTLILSVALVILVVFLFLRSTRAALIPSVAVPVSLAGTFGIMYLLGYSLDNFSLMALTISSGFVIDDATVVLENISRHIETGLTRMQASLQGVREVGLTVVSDQPLLSRRFYTGPTDGWDHRRAVPRIRYDIVDSDCDLACRLFDHNADDVRPSALGSPGYVAWATIPGRRAYLRRDAFALRRYIAPGAPMPRTRSRNAFGYVQSRRLLLFHYPEGVHSTTRQRVGRWQY
jgi:Cu/Ag efflux pump CusA